MVGDTVHYFGGDPDDPAVPDHCCPAIVRAENGTSRDLTINYQGWQWFSAEGVPQGGQTDSGSWHEKH